jgi:hypothetical protein
MRLEPSTTKQVLLIPSALGCYQMWEGTLHGEALRHGSRMLLRRTSMLATLKLVLLNCRSLHVSTSILHLMTFTAESWCSLMTARCLVQHSWFSKEIHWHSTSFSIVVLILKSCYRWDCLADEITRSYSLLFGQTDKGRKVLRRITKRPVCMAEPFKRLCENHPYNITFSENLRPYYVDNRANCIQVFSWKANDPSLKNFGSSRTPPSMTDFHIFGGRLQELKRQMDLEQSRRMRDLFKPGYGDRFTWYTQMFALALAIIGIVGLFLAVVQTAYAVQSYRRSTELALQGLEIALKSLNVSLEALELQKRQMNITTD